MRENQFGKRYSINFESPSVDDMPTDIHMLDISADKLRMAVIYKTVTKEETDVEDGKPRYMLTLYDMQTEGNNQMLKRNREFMEVDVSFIAESNFPCYVFLSSSGENGYVALSFVEMSEYGKFKNPSNNFSNCTIYGNTKTVKKIPFQGRAVFLEKRLVLVGQHTLEVFKLTARNSLEKEYTLDTYALNAGYEATKHQNDIIKDLSWAKYQSIDSASTIPAAGLDIITMSRHISNNILVTQYGGSGDGNVVRIWSILDGTLLTSYKSKNVEHVMAISDNYRYIATYDGVDKVARIYCTKTSMVLHTIPINSQIDIRTSDDFILTYMRFFGNGRYIVFSGYIRDTGKEQAYRKYIFEVWCIPAHKLLNREEVPVYCESKISPFAIESQNFSDKNAKRRPQMKSNRKKTKLFKPGYQYNLPEIKAIYTTQNSENSKLANITTTTLFKQDWTKSLENVPKEWKTADGESVCKITLLKKKTKKRAGEKYLSDLPKRPELNAPLNEFESLLCYSLQMGTDHYILRFGLYTVQLWRLKEIENTVSADDKQEKGFQLEESNAEDKPYFYKSMEDNELVYIRTYKATDYGSGFTFKEDWNLHVNLGIPEVLFMDDMGHIFVEIEYRLDYSKIMPHASPSDQGSRELIDYFKKKWPFNKMIEKPNKVSYNVIDVDEIFLPISKSPIASYINRSSTLNNKIGSTDAGFHELESACRALHHINCKDESRNRPALSEENFNMMNDKIYQIILRSLNMKKTVKYFTTVSGSRTLAMLASFRIGRDILKYIITKSRIPISVFSYAKEKNVQESMLSVLIEENEDDLFNLFFNRVLTDSLDAGPGNLSAIMDSLLYLQSQGISELLLNCSKKLSYIPVKLEKHPILGSEYIAKIKMKSLKQDYIPSLRTLESCSALEQVNKYDNTLRDRFLFIYARFKRNTFIKHLRSTPATISWFVFGEGKTTTSLARLCVVPLPRFNDYKIQPEENIFNEDEKQNMLLYNQTFNDKIKDDHIEHSDSKTSIKSDETEKVKTMNEKDAFEKIEYQQLSPFTSTASSSNDNQIFKQGDTVMEVLTQYKWKTFARTKFFWILFIHAIYYISYSTGVSFAQELYDYKPGDTPSHPGHLASIVLMFVSGSILLVQEFRQFLLRKMEYLTSFYNWIDLAAFALPIASFALLLTGNDLMLDVDSVAALVLWTHAILRLRVFCQFGKLLEIIIQLSGKIMPIIGIMILVVLAFTHAFIIRLRLLEDQTFQEQFQGGATDDEGNPLENATMITMYDTSSQNDFSNVFKAFSIVWFFIFGIFDPINDGDVGDDIMTIILAILFSFVTVLIFSNMVIALMSSTVEDVKRRGNKAWISHFAAVVAEVEMLWCTERQRHDRKNNPSYIYYVANVKTVRSKIELIREETNKLIDELNDEDD